MNVTFSIITPVLNGKKWIERSIKNIVEQNCTGIEHIIIDGCSKDGTCEIIKRYALKYSHIRWISEEDSGQVEALNKGIKIARGKIISILNADDLYEPNIFNRVLYCFENIPNPSLVVGNLYLWQPLTNKRVLIKPGKLTFNALLLGPRINLHPINPTSYFYHKSIHDHIGLYNSRFTYNMDLDFIIRAVQVANVKYVDEVWGNFYQHVECKTYFSISNNLVDKVDEEVIFEHINNINGWRKHWLLWRYLFVNWTRKICKYLIEKIIQKNGKKP